MRKYLSILLILGSYWSLAQTNITAMEYYLDTDPGYGNGTVVTIATPSAAVDVNFTIPQASLTQGFHILVVRTQDADGDWGVQESTTFYVSADDPQTIATVDNAEYFLDTDPGVGAATPITVTSGTAIDADFIIGQSNLTNGFHILVIRTIDSGGVWSMQESKAFYVSSSDVNVVTEVTSAEYYLDTDPGYGLATEIPLTSGQTFDASFVVSSADLPSGFHTLVIRVQDALGQWGVQQSTAFYVSSASPQSSTKIDAIEYFIDTDPGVGSGTAVDILDTTNFTLDVSAITNGLAGGVHTLNIRAKDVNGVWGMLESTPFMVDPFISNAPVTGVANEIASIEYFIDDTAPQTRLIDPAASTIDEDFVVSTTGLTNGTHTLGVKVANELGLASQVEYVDFTVCEGAQVAFDAAASICAGNTTTFIDTSTGVLTGDVYSWDFDGDGTEDSNVLGDASFKFTTAGNYTVSLTISNNDCSATKTLDITVLDGPTVTAVSSKSTVCNGEEITLTASGAVSYSWDSNVTDGLTFVPSSTTSYTVVGTDANGCKSTATLSVVVNPLPAVVANADVLAVCVNGEVTLTGSGATSYSWDNNVSDGLVFTQSSETTYTVTGTDAKGCVNTDQITIGINADPTVLATADTTRICLGAEVVLSGSGADTYTWDNDVQDGVAISPSVTTTYTTIGTDVNGCTGSGQVTITVLELPIVTATASELAVCVGSEVVLTGGGAVDYIWDNGVQNNVGIAQSATTTYTVTGTDGNGCQNSASVTVDALTLPTVVANTDATFVCPDGEVILTGSGADSYVWDNGVIDGQAASVATATTYTVTGTDINGCQNSDQIMIGIFDLPAVVASADDSEICAGDEVILTGSGAMSYTWDNDVVDGVAVTLTETTVFEIIGTDSNGCQNTDAITIVVNPLPTVVATASDNPICFGESVVLSGVGGQSFTWDNAVNDGVAFTPVATNLYTVTGTDGNGCQNTSSIEVVVIDLAKPTISIDLDNFLMTSDSELGNQWFKDGDIIPFATEQTYTVPKSGLYAVQVSEEDCVSEMSDALDVIVLGADGDLAAVQVWPNPVVQYMNIDLVSTSVQLHQFYIVDMSGAIMDVDIEAGRSMTSGSFDVSQLKGGVYLLMLQGRGVVTRFIKQ